MHVSRAICLRPLDKVPIIKGTEFQLHMHNVDVMAHCSKLVALTNNAGEVSSSSRTSNPGVEGWVRRSACRSSRLEGIGVSAVTKPVRLAPSPLVAGRVSTGQNVW